MNKEKIETIKKVAKTMNTLRSILFYDNIKGVVVGHIKEDLKFYLPKEIDNEIKDILKKHYDEYQELLKEL